MQLAVRISDNAVMNVRQRSGLTAADVAAQCGGAAGDYALVTVPVAQEASALSAYFISYNGSAFTYDTTIYISPGAPWVEQNGYITILANKWLAGNVVLPANINVYPVTSFPYSGSGYDNFRMALLRNDSTQVLSIGTSVAASGVPAHSYPGHTILNPDLYWGCYWVITGAWYYNGFWTQQYV